VSVLELRRACFVLLLASLGCVRSHPPVAVSTWALGEMRDVQRALETYAGRCGGYPGDLSRLVVPLAQRREADCRAVHLLDHNLVLEEKRGYRFEYLVARQASGAPAVFQRYELRATWVGGSEERRSFWTSNEGEIRSAQGRAAGPTDEVLR
jgi:hypothetical protein